MESEVSKTWKEYLDSKNGIEPIHKLPVENLIYPIDPWFPHITEKGTLIDSDMHSIYAAAISGCPELIPDPIDDGCVIHKKDNYNFSLVQNPWDKHEFMVVSIAIRWWTYQEAYHRRNAESGGPGQEALKRCVGHQRLLGKLENRLRSEWGSS